VFNLGRRC